MMAAIFLFKPAGGSNGADDPDIPASEDRDDFVDNITASPGRQSTISSGSGSATVLGKGAQRIAGLSTIAADRPIFTLSVAADLLGLHPRTLRIYEEKGLVIPARTYGNRRRYSQNDIQRFQVIRRLTLGGVNLEGVRIILDMSDEMGRLGGDANAIIEKNLRSPLGNEP